MPGRNQQATGGPRRGHQSRRRRGHPERVDYEYERNGTASLFPVTKPLVGQRHVTVTECCTAVDFARMIPDLVDRQLLHLAAANPFVVDRSPQQPNTPTFLQNLVDNPSR